MKNQLIFIFVLLPIFLFGQKEFKITKTVDEFTGDTLIQSAWVKMSNTDNANRQSYIRLSSSKGVNVFEIMYSTLGQIASISPGDEFYIKLQSGTVVTLKNSDFQISEKGKASPVFAGSEATGFHLFFPISNEDLLLLSQSRIEKCRLSTSKGFMETGISKEENRENVFLVFKNFFTALSN